MNAPPEVRLASDEDAPVVASVLSDAFVDEMGLNYWLRQGRAKERARRLFFDAAVRDVVHPQRALWLADAAGTPLGAALWLAPGQHAFELGFWKQIALAPLLWSVAGVSGTLRGLSLSEQISALHPREPHAHLVFLGVAPEAQGRGVGSAILKQTLAPLDATKTPALLEATTERNVGLYRRHGFDVIENLHAPSLHVRIMWRPPR